MFNLYVNKWVDLTEKGLRVSVRVQVQMFLSGQPTRYLATKVGEPYPVSEVWVQAIANVRVRNLTLHG